MTVSARGVAQVSRPRLVTINVWEKNSDSSMLTKGHHRLPLAFLDPLLHNSRDNRRRHHTHPEGRRERPIEAPATTRFIGQVLSPTARSWEMR